MWTHDFAISSADAVTSTAVHVFSVTLELQSVVKGQREDTERDDHDEGRVDPKAAH